MRLHTFDSESLVVVLPTQASSQFADLGIQHLLGQFVQVHSSGLNVAVPVLHSRAQIVYANILDGQVQRIVVLEHISEELIIPHAVRQHIGIKHGIVDTHLRETNCIFAQQRQRAEVCIHFAYVCQCVALLVFHVHIRYAHAYRKMILHSSDMCAGTQRTSELARYQSGQRCLYLVIQQHCNENDAHQQKAGERHTYYVQCTLHRRIWLSCLNGL